MLNRMLEILLAACLSAGVAQAAESPFEGQWKLDPSKSRLPDEMKVQSKGRNTYVFDFAGTAETIVVDGSEQPGVDGTLLSVTAEAPRAWMVERRKAGRLLLRARWRLSKDGRTLTDYFRGFQPDGATFSVDYIYQRRGEGSGFAADWRSIKEKLNSPFLMQVTPYQGDGLSLVIPAEHVARNVKFDGRDYPDGASGASGGVVSSARQADERTLSITTKRNGKVVTTEDLALSRDRKTLTLTQRVAGGDRPNLLVFERR